MKLKDAAFIMYGIEFPIAPPGSIYHKAKYVYEVWDDSDPDGDVHYFETCAACCGQGKDDEGNTCDECKGKKITPIDQEKSGHVEID